MCSYNLICQDCAPGQVGNWSCENDDTLRRDLKQRLNFSGWVMSDWTGAHRQIMRSPIKLSSCLACISLT